MNLDKIREQIDFIDTKLIHLFNERLELALRTRNYKKVTKDTSREIEVIDRIRQHSNHLIEPDFAEAIFARIIGESKRVQDRKPKLIGFQGAHGAYSEVAVRNFDPAAIPIPCRHFKDVFESVENAEIDLGMVPVENNLAGQIAAANDLLVERDLKIVAEARVPVHHALLCRREVEPESLRFVYSHPVALAQCEGMLMRRGLEPKSHYDTAGAAHTLMSDPQLRTVGVIASKLCAELYDLKVVEENVEDDHRNSTRFVIVSKDGISEGNKTSILFSTPNTAGSLTDILRVFSDRSINMTRIESRPLRGQPEQYGFLADLEGGAQTKPVAEALALLKAQSEVFKLLGTYNRYEEKTS